MAETAQPGQTVDGKTLSKLLMVGLERLRQLAKEGWIEKIGRNEYSLVGGVQGYIRFQQDQIARMRKNSGLIQIQRERAVQLQLKNQQQIGKLCDVDECYDMLDECWGLMRTEILAVPARFTRDMELRDKLEAEIGQAVNRGADHIAKAAVRGARRRPVKARTKNKPRRVGKAKPRAAGNGRKTRAVRA